MILHCFPYHIQNHNDIDYFPYWMEFRYNWIEFKFNWRETWCKLLSKVLEIAHGDSVEFL
jgi:hypothetical protein